LGVADIHDRHIDVEFESRSGGIGRLPGLPVFTVAVPVLGSAPPGATFAVTLSPGVTPWKDLQGAQYTVTVKPGALMVGGALAVQDVIPGGGPLPAGEVVRIDGTGFTSATTLEIDGVSFSSVQFVGPQEINFTLSAPADLTGKRVVLSNRDGGKVEFFSALHVNFIKRPSDGPLATIQPIFPLQTYASGSIPNSFGETSVIALENQNLAPVIVNLETATFHSAGVFTRTPITLPPGGVYIQDANIGGDLATVGSIIPSAPIRMLQIDASSAPDSPGATAQVNGSFLAPVLQVSVDLDSFAPPPFWTAPTAGTLVANAQIGSPGMTSVTLAVTLNEVPTPYTVSSATASGGHWLSVSSSHGVTCAFGTNCPSSSKFAIKVDPSSLTPGVYRGRVTVTPVVPAGFNAQPTLVSIVLNASAYPVISITGPDLLNSGPTLQLGASPGCSSCGRSILNVTSSGDPVQLTVKASTQSGGNWLTVTPTNATTPATVKVSADPAGLGGGNYYGTITISAPGNMQVIDVNFEIDLTPAPPAIDPDPASLLFSAKAGSPPPPSQTALVLSFANPAITSINLSVSTKVGKWLSASVIQGATPSVSVSVDPTGLAPGVYLGTVTITPAAGSGPANISGKIAVTLTVWTDPPPRVTVTPSSLIFTASGSDPPSQALTIQTGGIPLEYSLSVSTEDGGSWLAASEGLNAPTLPIFTPATATVVVMATNLTIGTHHGSVTITAPPGSANSVVIPVTVAVAPGGPPLVVSIVSSASGAVSAIAPGEIITIFGLNIGPAVPRGTIIVNGKVPTSLSGARVFFGNIPAPLLYSSVTQLNAIVPYEVLDATNGLAPPEPVLVEVESNGSRTSLGGVPVAPAAPSIFTLDATGQGQAAVLNQNNSVNSQTNPAIVGSVIQIYATGAGLTSPPGITGEVTQGDSKRPVLPVTVTIGGLDAQVQFAGAAPGEVSGLFQVNALVPRVAPGPAVPIVLTVGLAHSQNGVTIAVK